MQVLKKAGWIVGLVLWTTGLTVAGPSLVNGGLTDNLDGWTITPSGSITHGKTSTGNGYAYFMEGSTDSILSQAFQIPSDAKTLSFQFVFLSGGFRDKEATPDRFSVFLLDSGGSPLIAYPGEDYYYSLFYAKDTDSLVDRTLGTVEPKVASSLVTLDVSGVSGQEALLKFCLDPANDKMLTSVRLYDVAITETLVPVPGALLLGIVGMVGVRVLRRRL